VTFEPGKNNPGSRHRTWFRRSCSSSSNKNNTSLSGSPLRPPPPPPFPPTNTSSRPNTPNEYHTDDDESNADFVLARAALGKKNTNNDNNNNDGGGGESLEDVDMESLGESFGYTIDTDGESLAPPPRTATKYIHGVGSAANAIPGITTDEDSAIGAGGISSFTNDRGIFRWNENGTKMVYTPTTTSTTHKTGLGGVIVGEEQNGFIFDEYNKKWVVKEKIVGSKGKKNVSFPASTTSALRNTSTTTTTTTESSEHLKRVRSNESGGSVISGMTGMSEFTYDQIGDTNNSNNNNTTTTTTTNDNNSRKVIMTKKKKAASRSPNTPDNETGEEGFEISSSMGITLTPLTPATVYTNDNDTSIDDIDQLLLRVGPATLLSTPTRNINSKNNNDIDDGSTSMMTGFTDVYESSSTAISDMTTNIVTPERNNNGNRYNNNTNTTNTDDCGSSIHTGDPGRIIPKSKTKLEPPQPQQKHQQPSSSSSDGGSGGLFLGVGRRSVIPATHAHAAPSMLKISEDTPFDEDIPFDERSKINNKNDDGQRLHPPELNDNDEDDDSQGSINSEHVLKDLDSLSKFMYERKRSEKMKKRGQRGGGGGTSRGGGDWDDSKTSSARFGGVGRTTTSR
jgi:hypothetical protein